jgi:hypothetical protein
LYGQNNTHSVRTPESFATVEIAFEKEKQDFNDFIALPVFVAIYKQDVIEIKQLN